MSRAIIKIKRACEKHLTLLNPNLTTAYEGVNFTPPETMYQVVQFVPISPENPTMGDGYFRERVDVQIFVVGVSGKGTTDAFTRAELIAEHFKRGTTLIEDTATLKILKTPRISGSMISEGRVVVPVMFSVVTDVFS